MNKLLVALFAIFLASAPALAQDARTVRVERIARALGFEQYLTDIQAAHLASIKGQTSDLFLSLKNMGLPDDYLKAMEFKSEQIFLKATKAWDPKEASRIYAEGLLDILSDEDLVEAEKFVQSPEGKRIHRAIANSEANMVSYIQAKMDGVLKVEFDALLQEMKASAQRSARVFP
ncbi:hypothetical protein [Pseudaquabacterium rugosum]|uniref:DUF2059 domain-containing protein n=1 Tax=Pseudaquabacterium rugosum TaxID=2984194 RepID=A0ABU9B4T1_9BURK